MGAICMSSNESRKRAVRAYQAANPGTSYTRALRHVTSSQRRPLTAALGKGLDGATVSVNLDWPSQDGSGPHCLIVGAEIPSLLAVLGTSLAAGQRPGDIELVLCASAATQLTVEHRRLGAVDLIGHIRDVLAARHEFLSSVEVGDVAEAREQGHEVPTTVVLIEDVHNITWRTSKALDEWTRLGRSLGVNLVLGAPVASPAISADAKSPAQVLDSLVRAAFDGNGEFIHQATVTIFGLGDRRATLATSGPWNPVRNVPEPDVLVDFVFTVPGE